MVTFDCLEIVLLSNRIGFLLCIHASERGHPRYPTSLESSQQCCCIAAGMRQLSMILQTEWFLAWLV